MLVKKLFATTQSFNFLASFLPLQSSFDIIERLLNWGNAMTSHGTNQNIWSFHLVEYSNLRQACGDFYEQFRIQKATAGTSEVQIFIRRNSGRFALCYREAFRR